MQHGVLGAADVQVHATRRAASHPVALRFFADEAFVVMRIAKSEVIPARTGPLRHGVCLAQRFVGITNPIFRFRQWRFAGSGWLIIFQRRWNDRQFIFAERLVLSVLPNNGQRLAPITLPRKQPVAQLVIDRTFSGAVLLKPFGDFLFRFRTWQAINYRRVDRNSFADKSNRIFVSRRLHHFPDRQIEFSSKLQIALIVGRYAHDCTCAVTE